MSADTGDATTSAAEADAATTPTTAALATVALATVALATVALATVALATVALATTTPATTALEVVAMDSYGLDTSGSGAARGATAVEGTSFSAAVPVGAAFSVPPIMQWKALSGRTIRAAVREGDLPFGFAAPMIFFLCFYVPLRRSMEAGGLDYAQYLLPVIVLQAMFFTGMSAGDRAARDSFSGMGTRLRSMPVRPWLPMAARMSANLVRAGAGLAGAMVIGYVFGFRFHDALGAAGFVLLALAFAAAIVIGADALGVAAGKPEIGASALLAPQLLLVMMSTGLVPAEAFPGWIQPFVRNQPVSQAAAALRGLADGEFPAAVTISVVWCAGLIVVFTALSVLVERRRP
ncbi:ABC transporter permease [Nocardia seriolae]|uniref:ABC transporter permease n=1 Tax=Nocardia seriolae TaxID=37332 RepID=A0ABC9YZI2_9NOCA|nr:ABC transporter permease [Nocardia seriolae]BEK93070.1 hypothetical protein NSER024013_09760 [Nocardia seriolae]GAM48940.1 ABC transporter permease [Nocardia seriolae]GAP30864.1 ABC transporter permease [Nocardia seriolae]GEM26441.1 hypothetical protein NS2_46800 [Nocardia seriolae NBRC 15557]